MLLSGCGGSKSTSALPSAASRGASDLTQTTSLTFQNETPHTADGFVDSIGLNVHLGAYGSAYVNDFPAIQSLLVGLGVRHVRDGININQPSICNEDRELAAQGIHFLFTTAIAETSAVVTPWSSCVGSAIEAMEGPNEYDLTHPQSDTNWPATLDNYQNTLYSGVKAVAQIPVVSPALTSEGAYASLGNLSNVADYGNNHTYFLGRNPGTPGWGASDSFGTYGSIQWNLGVSGLPTGAKPLFVTEVGYADGPGIPYALPPATKARYTLRTFLEFFNAGAARTYLYELTDENSDEFKTYGLADLSASPKPAYYALKNLIAHLSDPGPSFATSPLAYTLTVPSSVHHTLLQRRNGSYALVLWVEQPDWDPTSNTTIPVAPETATLTFANVPHGVTQTTFNDTGNVSTSTLTASKTMTVSANINVTILDITP